MIVSKLPPSRLLGSLATTVSCPAFKCFVSTSRVLFVTSGWETAVFLISPANELDMTLFARVGHPGKLNRKGSKLVHDIFCWKLDTQGDTSRKPLGECLSGVVEELREAHMISWVMVN